MPYFNPGTWQPQPFTPGSGPGTFQPTPPFRPLPNPNIPATNLPQPTPGVEPSPYVPPNAGDVVDLRPGFAPGMGISSGPRQLVGNLYGGQGSILGNLGQYGAGAAGSALLGPAGGILGSLIGRLLYNRVTEPFSATVFPEGYTYEDYQRDLNAPSNFLSRQREGSTRFSQGEMDLSNLPIERSPQQYMPTVFAGQRGNVLPGGGGRGPITDMR